MFGFFTLLGHNIASGDNVVVTVLHLLRALHRRIIVCIVYCQKSKTETTHKSKSIHGHYFTVIKPFHCLLSRSQRLVGL